MPDGRSLFAPLTTHISKCVVRLQNMNDENDPRGESIDSTLQKIRTRVTAIIRQGAKPDMELLDILTKHIVVPSPEEDAVKQAVDDIKKLVDERAEGH